MEYIIFFIAMVSLIYGANLIIIQSEKIALYFNISSFVIGATLIGLGTSLPEMAASITATLNDKSDLAISNVLGSNTINISLILGTIFFLAHNVNPKRDIFRYDSAWILIPPIFFVVTSFDGVISRLDGIVLLFMMIAYLIFLKTDAKTFEDAIDTDIVKEKFDWLRSSLFLVLGFIFVILGAKYTITSASQIARDLGTSEWIIGLLLIAFGTSLPELVVSIMAIKKKNIDMAIGNIIGSNVANIAVVLGASAIVHPLYINILENSYDILCMFASAILLIFISANKFYNKSSAILLFSILLLMIAHSLNAFSV
ncbi:calcium/sodium antiporter [Sulfurospirillum sp. 1612]|uniref:calcium/sodium antiporter n=1 Tax=Sulfurospirillum sp. 1612 TaxID=3094835 RepID=UPI002F958BF1